MLRIGVFVAASLFFVPSVAAAPADPEGALYRAQRYAYGGFFAEAVRELAAARGTTPRCPILVKLRTRGGDIPLCAPASVVAPAGLRSRVEGLLARSASAAPARAAALLDEARRLDPFDDRLVAPLVRALRSLGRQADARRVEAEAAALRLGRTVLRADLWAGSR